MEMSICKICKEPIWNFICINCLARDLGSKLSGNLSDSFMRFHRDFLNHFHSESDQLVRCLRCGISDAPAICIDCYMNEVYNWSKNSNPHITVEIQKVFRFDFRKHEKIMEEHTIIPITEFDNEKRDSGVCDECGEYSDELVLVEGEWLCPECGEYVRA